MKNQINKPKQILATLCYVKDHGKTLMIHRVKKQGDMHEGKWNGLGGKIEVGESPEECVIREVIDNDNRNYTSTRKLRYSSASVEKEFSTGSNNNF